MFQRAIRWVRRYGELARGAIAIVIAHRPGVLSVCDKVLYLADGVQKAFGPRDDVLRSILAPPRQAAAHANLKVVAESGAAAR